MSIIFSAIYLRPKHTIHQQNSSFFFHSLGNFFIAGGDYIAKNTCWRSRLTTTRGRELNLNAMSTDKPTYWPSEFESFTSNTYIFPKL